MPNDLLVDFPRPWSVKDVHNNIRPSPSRLALKLIAPGDTRVP